MTLKQLAEHILALSIEDQNRIAIFFDGEFDDEVEVSHIRFCDANRAELLSDLSERIEND